jgi:hypothetical protein
MKKIITISLILILTYYGIIAVRTINTANTINDRYNAQIIAVMGE